MTNIIVTSVLTLCLFATVGVVFIWVNFISELTTRNYAAGCALSVATMVAAVWVVLYVMVSL